MKTSLIDLLEGFPDNGFSPAPHCPICRGSSKVRLPARNIHPDKPYRFDLRACTRCAHGWIDPMPSQALLSHLYERASLSVIGVGWAAGKPFGLTYPELLVAQRELGVTSSPGSYFELGVGKGLLYHCFVDRGWRCAGVEPGDWGRDLPGVVPEIDKVSSTIVADLVVALDVLEHVCDPVATLRRLRRIAAPGARLYAATPNRQSWRALIGGHRWRMIRPLGHLHYWSKQSITLAVESAGFSLDWLRNTDLCGPHHPRFPRSVFVAAVQRVSLGDQWILSAIAS
jgi:hypothetical protein